MFAAFERLPEVKKRHILNISVEEFALHGYNHTSTDQIIGRAGISKGILFHYFKSKKNLFLYVLDYVMTLLADRTLDQIGELNERDFFERIKDMLALKCRLAADYYHETRLLLNTRLNPPAALHQELADLYKSFDDKYRTAEIIDLVHKRSLLDTHRLRSDIPVESVIRMSLIATEHIGNRFMESYKSSRYQVMELLEPMLQELDEYFAIMKHGIYKKEKELER